MAEFKIKIELDDGTVELVDLKFDFESLPPDSIKRAAQLWNEGDAPSLTAALLFVGADLPDDIWPVIRPVLTEAVLGRGEFEMVDF